MAYSKIVFLTSGTAWTVPSDWNSADNQIEAVGAGGGGSNGYGYGNGGGGGAYAKINNLALTSGNSISYAAGAAGAGGAASSSAAHAGTAGGSSYFNGTSLSGS